MQKHPRKKRRNDPSNVQKRRLRLQKLTDDILDVTRIESETLMLKIEPGLEPQ